VFPDLRIITSKLHSEEDDHDGRNDQSEERKSVSGQIVEFLAHHTSDRR